jgi:hypothetical protein
MERYIPTDLREVGCENEMYMQLIPARQQWRMFVQMVKNLRVILVSKRIDLIFSVIQTAAVMKHMLEVAQ